MTPEERADAVMEEYGCPGISIRTLIADAIRTAEQEAVEPYRKVVEAGRIAFKACQEAVDDKRTAEGACLIAQAELGEALRSLLPGADKPATKQEGGMDKAKENKCLTCARDYCRARNDDKCMGWEENKCAGCVNNDGVCPYPFGCDGYDDKLIPSPVGGDLKQPTPYKPIESICSNKVDVSLPAQPPAVEKSCGSCGRNAQHKIGGGVFCLEGVLLDCPSEGFARWQPATKQEQKDRT